MTTEERRQVVTLLHLAAVLVDEGHNWPPAICEAERLLGFGNGSINYPGPISLLAQWAGAAANGGFALGCSKDRAATCREAAVLVANGAWSPNAEVLRG